MPSSDLERRVVRWFSDERNVIPLLYLLSVGLGLASIAIYMTGSRQSPGRLALSLLIASGAVIFYVVIVSIANRPA